MRVKLIFCLIVNTGDYVRCKVEDFLEVLARDIKKTCQRDAGWALEVPDVAYRSSKLDVAHAVLQEPNQLPSGTSS